MRIAIIIGGTIARSVTLYFSTVVRYVSRSNRRIIYATEPAFSVEICDTGAADAWNMGTAMTREIYSSMSGVSETIVLVSQSSPPS